MSTYQNPEYVCYSHEQIQRARNADMVDFLERYEGFNFKKVGSYIKCKEHNSLVICSDRYGWFWNSKDIGGSTAIDYVEKIYGKKFDEAIGIILNEAPAETFTPQSMYSNQKKTTANKSRDLSLPKSADGNFNRAFAYLNKTRFIQNEIISQIMHEKKIYQDDHGNIVFVGYNEKNEACCGSIRGTLSDVRYRREVAGSDKRYGFRMNGSEETKDTIYVFESPIDAMSHATIANLVLGDNNAWKKHSRLSLGGVADNALEHFLGQNPDVKNIIFCLDNDEAGKSSTEKYKEKYIAKGYVVRSRPSKQKDYNEDLVQLVSIEHQKLKNDIAPSKCSNKYSR